MSCVLFQYYKPVSDMSSRSMRLDFSGKRCLVGLRVFVLLWFGERSGGDIVVALFFDARCILVKKGSGKGEDLLCHEKRVI